MTAGRFAGSVVLVTGGGRGIGRAVALGFAAEGAAVVVCSRTGSQCAEVAEEIRALGARALDLVVDVTRVDDVRSAVQRVVDEFGGIDVCVNCAGVFAMTPAAQTSTEVFRQLVDTNLGGTYTTCREVGAVMLERGRGKIINFASLLSFTAFPGRAGYAASKGGVLQLTKVLGIEWAAAGINVNAVAPGMIRIETPHPEVVAGALTEDAIVTRIPAGRRGVPSDIVGPVLFLASGDADYVHGQTLVVDGGWLSNGYL